MQSNQMEEKCAKHDQNSLFIDFSQSETGIKHLCAICIIEEQANLALVDDARMDLKNFYNSHLEEKKKIYHKNIELLNEFKENLKQTQINFNKQLEKCLGNLEQQINIVSQDFSQFQEKIQFLPDQNINNLTQFLQKIQQSSINFEDIKSTLLQELPQLSTENFIQRSKKIIEEMIDNYNQVLNQCSKKTLKELKKQQKLSLECIRHQNQQIAFVDLSEVQIVPDRFACLNCIPDYVTKYTSLSQFEQLWTNRKFQRCEKVTFFLKEIESVISQKKPIFHNIKQVLLDIINKLELQINQMSGDIFQTFPQLPLIYKKDYSQLNKQELTQVAQILSQNEQEDKCIDSLQKTFMQWKEQINQFSSQILLEILDLVEQNQVIKPNNNQINIQNTKSLLNNNPLKIQVQKINFSLKNNKSSLAVSSKVLNLKLNINVEKNKDGFSIQNQENVNSEFKYEQISQIEDRNNAQSLSLNQDSTLLAVGYQYQINIYDLNMGQLEKIWTFYEKNLYFHCLEFMKKSNNFCSGGTDFQIKIWEQYINKEWKCQTILKGHTSYINCLIVCQDDNLIISGGGDHQIKFWINNDECQCYQTLEGHSNTIESLSLDNSETKLISSDHNHHIFVSQYQCNQQRWVIIQKLQTQYVPIRLCFIKEELFVIQQQRCDSLYLFEFNHGNNIFQEKQQFPIQLSCEENKYQQFQFIKQKSLLIYSNGHFLNLIKIAHEDQLSLQQSIDFKTDKLVYKMSYDGEYLVSLDRRSYQLQVRKLKQMI